VRKNWGVNLAALPSALASRCSLIVLGLESDPYLTEVRLKTVAQVDCM